MDATNHALAGVIRLLQRMISRGQKACGPINWPLWTDRSWEQCARH